MLPGIWPVESTPKETPNKLFLPRYATGQPELLTPDGVIVSFGWCTEGMGIGRGFSIVEMLLVGHGAHHNDTI